MASKHWGQGYKLSIQLIYMHNADINECVRNTDGCDHNCSNTIGSYECSCRTGYSLAANRRSCEGMVYTFHQLSNTTATSRGKATVTDL